jgi:hypothetical protein
VLRSSMRRKIRRWAHGMIDTFQVARQNDCVNTRKAHRLSRGDVSGFIQRIKGRPYVQHMPNDPCFAAFNVS